MALQTWKQLGEAADIEDCRMESVLTMGRLCRRLNPKLESRITTEEDRSSETVCMLCGKDQTDTEYMVHGLRIGNSTGAICKECTGLYSAYLSMKHRSA